MPWYCLQDPKTGQEVTLRETINYTRRGKCISQIPPESPNHHVTMHKTSQDQHDLQLQTTPCTFQPHACTLGCLCCTEQRVVPHPLASSEGPLVINNKERVSLSGRETQVTADRLRGECDWLYAAIFPLRNLGRLHLTDGHVSQYLQR